jgi:PadR family transcriptional regulator PadR
MKRNYIEQLKKGITETALLYLINEVPNYGYNLIKVLEKRTIGYLRLKGGTIYPALQRLELMGLVKSQWRRSAKFPARKYYQITDKGQQFLSGRLTEWKDFSLAVSSIIGMTANGKASSPHKA